MSYKKKTTTQGVDYLVLEERIENAKKIPSDDVAQWHGYWEDKEVITDANAEIICQWQSAKCSVCNRYHTTPYMYYFKNYAYCPNCGAAMDEGGRR